MLGLFQSIPSGLSRGFLKLGPKNFGILDNLASFSSHFRVFQFISRKNTIKCPKLNTLIPSRKIKIDLEFYQLSKHKLAPQKTSLIDPEIAQNATLWIALVLLICMFRKLGKFHIEYAHFSTFLIFLYIFYDEIGLNVSFWT